ncbi:MAG: hypothetical protein ACRBBN_08955 [Methyloligellaceae bacterium]
MRTQGSGLNKMKIAVLSVAAAVFTFIAAGSASAMNLKSGSMQVVVSATGETADVIKVHHKKKRWRKHGFHISIGTPYYYGYYDDFPRYRYCRKWRKRCAYRYGWKTWRWRKCMRRRACY